MDDTTTQTRPASPTFPNPVRLVYTALGYGVVLSTALAFWLVERVRVGVPFIVAAAGLAGVLLYRSAARSQYVTLRAAYLTTAVVASLVFAGTVLPVGVWVLERVSETLAN